VQVSVKYLHDCLCDKAQMSYNYQPGSCAAQFSVVKKKKAKKQVGYMWDKGPQSIESLKPQNPGCFLLQISLYSPGLTLLLRIHIAEIHTDMTPARGR